MEGHIGTVKVFLRESIAFFPFSLIHTWMTLRVPGVRESDWSFGLKMEESYFLYYSGVPHAYSELLSALAYR